MKITSSAFEHNSEIPFIYTCDGENINPPLEFVQVPTNAKSLVLIVDDPDAPMGTFVHWVLFNVSPKSKGVKENSIPDSAIQGLNSANKTGYMGPCPPSNTHRYFFKLYALDMKLNLLQKSTKQELEQAIQGHILDKAELVGLYSRRTETSPGR